ncbi:MAG: phosphoribosylamine--glycine ligase [Bacteroidetes bacterium]|nr:phosphoribosylamine--glycine ligase [Bacteroidota bacterium]
MNVLLIGSGGREHALAWAIAKSPLCDQLFTAPGNPGTAQCGRNVALDIQNFEEVVRFIESHDIALTVVGPEQPLVQGIADYLINRNHAVFGPTKAAARLEGSKQFAKDFMSRHHIPTAAYRVFTHEQFQDAATYIQSQNRYPVVLKADGLAGGKGVLIPESEQEAMEALKELKEGQLKQASEILVIEEFMEGEEASVFAICDGNGFEIIGTAQDHKRQLDGDKGPNTGGMGAYSPSPLMTDEMLSVVREQIIEPTIRGMKEEGSPYTGFLYVGLMLTQDGPKVVEYNCRFGDPECQVIIPRLESDVLQHMYQSTQGALEAEQITFDTHFRTTVVLVSGGYPGSYQKEQAINGLEQAETLSDIQVFHAGTKQFNDEILSAGGRVINVVGSGPTLQSSIDKAYKGVECIHFNTMFYRKDIGAKGLKHVS